MRIVRFGIILIFALLILGFFGVFKISIASPILSIRNFIENVVRGEEAYKIDALLAENTRLKSELLKYGVSDISIRDDDYEYLEAGLYSHFPFTNRSLVSINKGSVNGVKVGMPVLTEDFFIFGLVKSVSRTSSEVITIFDPSSRYAVFIGSSKDKAVLLGGVAPVIDLIPRNTNISSLPAVLNASPNFPYGLPLGAIGTPTLSSGGALIKAEFKVPYNFETLERVLIITNFP